MTLSNDTLRCHGESASVCLVRHNCVRYLDRFGGGEWTTATNNFCAERKEDMQIKAEG